MNDLSPFSPPQPVRTPLPTREAFPIAAGVAVPVLAVLSHGWSLQSLAAGAAIGALALGGTLTLLRNFKPTLSSCLVGGGVVGAACGIAWWSLMDSARSLEECALRGALGGTALLALQLYSHVRRAQS